MSASRLAVVLTAGALAACDLEFIGPESPAQYEVVVTFTDSISTRSAVRATLSPGVTPAGEERAIPDDAIRVWDRTLTPSGIDDAGVRSYEALVETDPRTMPTPVVSTQPPDVESAGTPSDLSLPLVWRSGPEAVSVPRADDLVLQIANAAGLDTAAQGMAWSLVLRVEGGDDFRTVFRTASLGLPPEQVIVPATTLAIEAGQLWAELEASYFTRSETFRGFLDGGVSYEAELRVTTHLYWTLRLVN